ncbi:MAG: SMI1/KNR4 family protein [Hymenobacter sp.]|nr:MAG: SMI1/KNR4 family protein [Hymenobacter sp.]
MSFFPDNQVQVTFPASAIQIANARAEFGSQLPEAVIMLWQESDGASFPETGVVMYSTADIAERNATYEVVEYAPDLILIGDDSGGNGLFMRATAESTEVLKIGLGAVGSAEGIVLATSLIAWVGQGCLMGKEDLGTPRETNEKVDIILEKSPKDGLKSMLLIKQKLALALSTAQLKLAMEQVPVTLIKGAYYSKYKSSLEEINQTQHCLKVIRAS